MTGGVLVTQEGVDVADALDSQKVLDTRWKSFEILKEYVFTMPALVQSSGIQEIYTHGLGFLPAFDIYDTVLGSYVLGGFADGTGCVSDTGRIYFKGFYNDDGWSGHKCVLRIFNLDPTQEYTAPIVKTLPQKGSTKQSHGIKILRDTSDIVEDELSKFALNTKSKALQIQKTGLTTANSGTNFRAVIQHNLGYPPTYMATWADINRQWIAAINPDFVPVIGRADGATIEFGGAQSALTGTFTYIIFKELGDFAI
jgi:hypothetical protein